MAHFVPLKVFESDEESGNLTLTILNSGHFFISQGQTMLEGFSLIAAQTWLKVGKKSDCLLFQSKARQEFRMFRVQFNGESSEQSLENCLNCVQKLQMYVPVQIKYLLVEFLISTPPGSHLVLRRGKASFDSMALEITIPKQKGFSNYALLNPQNKQLGIAYQDLFLSTEELGPFIKLCLLDQHFPAFVETVEEELYKLKEG
ncbi:meiotic recombination protein REC114 [Rhinophrynus dorsalis]